MSLSQDAQSIIGLMILSITTIQFGGYFLFSQMGRNTVIRTEMQRAYFRAGHAHAGVLVTLGIVAQMLVDTAALADGLAWPVRIGFVLAPVLISAGFFLGAPTEGTQTRPLIRLVPAGAIVLALCLITLGLFLIF